MAAKEMASGRRKKLRALAEVMNKQNVVPIPITHALLECFDVVITTEEADFLLKVGNEPHTYEELTSLSGLEEKKFRPFLHRQLEKGLIEIYFDEDGKEHFQLPAIAPGWFEHHLSAGRDTPETREFARRVDNYIQSFSKYNIFPLRFFANRISITSKTARSIALPSQSCISKKTVTIDVDHEVDVPVTKVYPTWDVLELIEKYGDRNEICVIHCFCRHYHELIDEPCRFNIPSESCITIGKFTKYLAKYGLGRMISKEEALEIIKQAEKKGAVHQLFYEKEDMDLPEIAICNCCWDCCGVLGPYNRGTLPALVKSYYVSQVSDESSCDGCGRCEKYCPVNNISIIDKKVNIGSERCIGCGQCEIKCPNSVITLNYKEREVFLPIQKKSKLRITS